MRRGSGAARVVERGARRHAPGASPGSERTLDGLARSTPSAQVAMGRLRRILAPQIAPRWTARESAGPAALPQRDVEAFAGQVHHALRGLELHAQARMPSPPQRHARHQPALRERRQQRDAQRVRLARGRRRGATQPVVESVECGLHGALQRGARAVQHHAAPAAVEQPEADLLLQQRDLLADGAGGEVQFVGGLAKVLAPRHGAEGRQGVQRQAGHWQCL